jgi:membrane protein DedA with SNARE-associated domain/rhodanese-related sulfurtransferase
VHERCAIIIVTAMESLLADIAEHGYTILFTVVFLEAIGFPVPAALGLLIAGAASTTGAMNASAVLAGSIAAMVAGDTLMFLLGRYTGWWLLGILCRLSINPESCILRSADSFYRRGRVLLVIAKFLPGINTMAPPLAGSMNMRLARFLPLDIAGTALYIGAWWAAGFLFSGALEALSSGYQQVSSALGWALAAAIVVYLGMHLWIWNKARRLGSVPFALPGDIAPTAAIYDVRSHGYYDSKARRIAGSRRLDPNALHQMDLLALETPAYLYCTCVREATSARVARVLLDKGITCAVIKGGLRAWKKAGLPLERVPSEEMAILPVFD